MEGEKDGIKIHLVENSHRSRDSGYVEPHCIAARHVLAIMGFLGFFNVYCLRVNLSVAMVAMVNSSDDNNNKTDAYECPVPDGNSTSNMITGEFNWDEKTQGSVLGSFFYGYILTQIPGGYLAARFGGKSLFGLGVLCTAVLTLVTPVAARTSVYLLIMVRILEGIGEGVTFPAMHAMWGCWAPLWERSRLISFTYAGAQLGTVISLPISGVLCDSDFLGGWPSVFYIFGALGCVWFIAWMLIVHSTPDQHPHISQEERQYIENSIGKSEVLPTPWKSILTSPAVLCLCVTHFTINWGFYTLLTCLPIYLKTILKFDIKENGFLSALPYLVMFIVQISIGYGADYVRSHEYLSTKNTRRLFSTVGIVLPGSLLIVSGYVGCDHLLVITFLTLSVGISGFVYGGFNANHLDIAPRFAGVLMGLTNSIGTIPGFLAPAVVGILTNHNQTMEQWHKIFFINAGVCIVGILVFLIFVQGEEQSWAQPPTTAAGKCPESTEYESIPSYINQGQDTSHILCYAKDGLGQNPSSFQDKNRKQVGKQIQGKEDTASASLPTMMGGQKTPPRKSKDSDQGQDKTKQSHSKTKTEGNWKTDKRG